METDTELENLSIKHSLLQRPDYRNWYISVKTTVSHYFGGSTLVYTNHPVTLTVLTVWN